MRVVMIGGSDAGISAALRVRELDPSVEVTVVVADAYPDFSIRGIPYYISGEVGHCSKLAPQPPRPRGDRAATCRRSRYSTGSPHGCGVGRPAPSTRRRRDHLVHRFRPDLRHLARLPLTRRNGLPATDPALPSRSVDNPTLFFLGYGDWCGPASATLIGVGAAAQATVDSALTLLRPASA
jgi:hypothetical protein